MNWDFSSEEAIYQKLRKNYPAEWGDRAPPGSTAGTWFYNTMFMWPLLTFGWELFLECCLDERFERVMDEFAEINRRVFRALARLPINFITCHDDIVMTRGPVCSRRWMNEYIFPRYEEYFSTLHDGGVEVIFMADGCMDAFADDVIACGARGVDTEPYTDFKAIARKHKDCYLAGEGDSRVLHRNNPEEIYAMVKSMAETARMSRGYFLCCGNHIPWNVNPEGVKRYLDLCNEIGYR
jgi:uroporphyrinogen-III decarboxylase